MSLLTYTTNADDVLDKVCLDYYGSIGMTVAVLEANPLLANYSTHLPRGLVLKMPEQSESDTAQTIATVRLWD